MVNQDILGALKSAMIRGQSLQSAMQTLTNTGYPQNEIQTAAKFLEEGEQPQQVQQSQPVKKIKQVVQPPEQSLEPEKTPQKVSSYEQINQRVIKKQTQQNKEKGSKVLAITLIIILAILLGALIALFLFKDQIITMFS